MSHVDVLVVMSIQHASTCICVGSYVDSTRAYVLVVSVPAYAMAAWMDKMSDTRSGSAGVEFLDTCGVPLVSFIHVES